MSQPFGKHVKITVAIQIETTQMTWNQSNHYLFPAPKLLHQWKRKMPLQEQHLRSWR